ncbi:MAG: hypothetical protein QXL17_06420 [Candidatus Thermoplasmatota archaeon]
MTMWQDYVIAVVSISFGFMLVPQLRDVFRGNCVNLYTAGLTTIGLFILGFTFSTLQMWVTVIAEVFSGTIWLFLFVFSLRNYTKKDFKKGFIE